MRIGLVTGGRPMPDDRWPVARLIVGLRARGHEVVDGPGGDAALVPYALSHDPAPTVAPIVARLADARWAWPDAQPLTAADGEADREALGRRAHAWFGAAAGIAVPSEHMRQTLLELAPALGDGRIVVIPPDLPPAVATRSVPPAHPALLAGDYVVLVLDQDDPGPLVRALQGFATVRFRSSASLPAVVALGGAEPDRIAAHGALLGLGPDRLVCVGDPPEAERVAIMRRAALVVVPDAYVGASQGIEQAVAAEAALISAWTVPALESLARLQVVPRFFAWDDPESLARALERTLVDAARPRASARWALEQPQADALTSWETLLLEVAEGRPPRSVGRSAPPVRSPPGPVTRPAHPVPGVAPGRVVVHLPTEGSLGGIRVAEELIRALLERGGEAAVAVAAPAAVAAEMSRRVGPVPATMYEAAEAWDRTARIRCEPGDVVWTPWPHGAVPPDAGEAPLACTWHDFNFRRHSTLGPEFIAREEEVANAWFTRCAVVFHSSYFIADELRHFYPWAAGRSRVVPLAVADAFRRAPKPEAVAALARFALPERFLLVPAGYHEHKNQDRLLQAVDGLEPRPAIVLTGTRTWMLDGWAPWATGLGVVESEEVRALYERCAGVVIPTLYEAGSFPIMEAMAVGRPAAGSLIPPIVEQVERIGAPMLGFDPLDVKGIAEAVARLWRGDASDPERLERARTATLSRTWEDVARGYLEVLAPLAPPVRRGTSGSTVVPSRP